MEFWNTVVATLGSVIVAMVTVGLPLFQQNRKVRRRDTESILELVQQLKCSVEKIENDMSVNNQLTISNARAQLESIYRKYERKKSMPESSWKAVCELHESYKLITLPNGKHPNSWADALYEEMRNWDKE